MFSPIDRLTLSLDYYNITLEDQVGALPIQDILNIEASDCPTGSPINRSPLVQRNPTTGAIVLISANNQNIAGVETDGLDFEADYSFDPRSDLQPEPTISHVRNDARTSRGVFSSSSTKPSSPTCAPSSRWVGARATSRPRSSAP